MTDYYKLERTGNLRHARFIKRGERVNTYGNLHTGKVSIRDARSVIGHADRVFLNDVYFKVGERARARVVRERRRYVHAFANGEALYFNNEFRLLNFEEEIRYSPFRAGHFTRPDGSAIWQTKTALVVADKKEDGSPYIYILTNPVIQVLI
jgi:hypothetical protein